MFPVRLFLARALRATNANIRLFLIAFKRTTPKHRRNLHPACFCLFPCFFVVLLPLVFIYFSPVSFSTAFVHHSPHSRSSTFDTLLPVSSRYSLSHPNASDRTIHQVDRRLGPRPSIQHYSPSLPVSPTQDPVIRLLFACDIRDPCCDATFDHSLRAALRQSLTPSHLTILHGCPATSNRATAFLSSVRRVVADSLQPIIYDTSVITSQSFIQAHQCTSSPASQTPNMELCILHYLASPRNDTSIFKSSGLVMIVTPFTILEPTAVESLWLYLFLRPTLFAVRPQSYDRSSLKQYLTTSDPLSINVSFPDSSREEQTPVQSLPLMISQQALSRLFSTNITANATTLWLQFAQLVSNSRLVQVPLWTHAYPSSNYTDLMQPPSVPSMLSIRHSEVPKTILQPRLWSEYAYYKSSSRAHAREQYSNDLATEDARNSFDFWGMPFRRVTFSPDIEKNPRFMFIMPWIQMGGSEKCMLDIANRLVQMRWPVTFLLTMPFWQENPLGEISLRHEWINKALAITPDVFDIINLSPSDKFTKTLRYILESRSPDYILTANSRIIYEHLAFIKKVSPKTVIADYNHMVHMSWEVVPGKGGGMPRYGASYTDSIDVHLTASDNVTNSIKSWIDPIVLKESPHKVRTCYIGTDPSTLHTEKTRPVARAKMRRELGLKDETLVVLFAGRYVPDKGINVMGELVRRLAEEPELASKLAFVFVGSGIQLEMLEETKMWLGDRDPVMILRPPAVGITTLREYYAMADIFLLPSNNEGIALVLYEAMAAGLLVMSTDVGGQKELIRSNTGVLLPVLPDSYSAAVFIMRQLQAIIKFDKMFLEIQRVGTKTAREKFTTDKFCECTIQNMVKAKRELDRKKPSDAPLEKDIEEMRLDLAEVMRVERSHGIWNQQQVVRSVSQTVTVGIKTYVCDASIVRQVLGLVRSIRVNYPTVRVLLANDGPTRLGSNEMIAADPYTEEIILPPDSGISIGRNIMVNLTKTEFFVLLDDDHVFDDDTDLSVAVNGLSRHGFDIVGIRVRNLPGIDELERISIFIPRYVAKITKFENREVTLCVWNENSGPGVQRMRVPIAVDVLHNALIARTDVLAAHPWRNELKVNEHMTFFLDARRANLRVGYLPSVFVHHRARRYSECYKAVRFREDKYEKLLEYKDDYLWDVECGDNFPSEVSQHLEETGR